MNTREKIRSAISKDGLGIEITPVHKPIAPKKEGFRCLSLDRRSRTEIESQMADLYKKHPVWLEEIEEVDLLGHPAQIADLAESGGYGPGTFDYIISPHNFEHLPNPIDFLHQCRKVLKPTGSLFLTMPDRRACFDYYRPFSTLAEILASHFEKRVRPTQSQIFEHRSLYAQFVKDGEGYTSFPLGTPPERVLPAESLKEAFAEWKDWERSPDERYRDAHCWTFTPSSLELILTDLIYLGLLPFDLHDLCQAGEDNNEIYAHLGQPVEDRIRAVGKVEFYEKRAALLRKMHMEEKGGAP